MRDQYKKLFEEVEQLKTNVEELELLEEESANASRRASETIKTVKDKYKKSVSELQEKIEAAEQENEANKIEIKELTRQQLINGSAFHGSDRLAFLKAEVATHPLKIETMQQLLNEVSISLEESEELDRLRAIEHNINAARRTRETAILAMLANIRGDTTTNCLACYDGYLMEGRSRFIDEKYTELYHMRKGD